MKIIPGSITAPKGFLAQGVEAEIKYKNKKDLAVIYSEVPCNAAGVFTTNVVRAACVDWNQTALGEGQAQAIVANSGNANACTGHQGEADTAQIAFTVAKALGLEATDVLVASTGVIGVPLPMDRIHRGIETALGKLNAWGGENAAQAIMTTDLVSKELAVEIELGGKKAIIGSIAKGSGMIHPNMATMLGFIATDAAISSACLKEALTKATYKSFNMISVDGDTSTNDMVLIMANGLAGNEEIADGGSPDFQVFSAALEFICIELAKKIARDGEGATSMMEVQVINAESELQARTIARSVTTSSLVKTALFGEDANWGRILAAAGYSGAAFNPATVDIYLGKVQVAAGGMGLSFDEEAAKSELQQEQIIITLDLKSGKNKATAWGCDLGFDYIKINADYRT